MGLPSRTDRRDGMALQAALSNLRIEFIDGPMGDNISEKAVPTGEDGKHLLAGELGCWRGHINALQEYVPLLSNPAQSSKILFLFLPCPHPPVIIRDIMRCANKGYTESSVSTFLQRLSSKMTPTGMSVSAPSCKTSPSLRRL